MKKDSRGEGSSRPQKKKKKVIVLLDEDKVYLSGRQKTMLLKDTSGVIQQSSKASDTTTSSKLPEASNLVVSDSTISARILPIPPPSTSQPIPYFLNQYFPNQSLNPSYFHLP